MDLILIILAFLQTSLPLGAASLPPDWSCTSPRTRATMNTAIQERLALLGMGQMPQISKVLEGLSEATSPRALAIAHQLEQSNNLAESTSKVCEVTMPDVGEAMFITVLYVNPSTGLPGGAIFNFGLGPVMVSFGSDDK